MTKRKKKWETNVLLSFNCTFLSDPKRLLIDKSPGTKSVLYTSIFFALTMPLDIMVDDTLLLAMAYYENERASLWFGTWLNQSYTKWGYAEMTAPLFKGTEIHFINNGITVWSDNSVLPLRARENWEKAFFRNILFL